MHWIANQRSWVLTFHGDKIVIFQLASCGDIQRAFSKKSNIRVQGYYKDNSQEAVYFILIPEPTARSAVPGVSLGRGLLIPHGYLHPGKKTA